MLKQEIGTFLLINSNETPEFISGGTIDAEREALIREKRQCSHHQPESSSIEHIIRVELVDSIQIQYMHNSSASYAERDSS